jgi:hypothetical protein
MYLFYGHQNRINRFADAALLAFLKGLPAGSRIGMDSTGT